LKTEGGEGEALMVVMGCLFSSSQLTFQSTYIHDLTDAFRDAFGYPAIKTSAFAPPLLTSSQWG
jgi:hypothetical protein